MSDLMIKPATPQVASSGHSALASVPPPAKPSAPTGQEVNASVSFVEKPVVSKKDDKISTDLLEKAAANIQKYLPQQPPGTQLRIERDKATNLFVYQSVNAKSGEVVSQYPSKEVLQFISFYREKEGLAVDQSA